MAVSRPLTDYRYGFYLDHAAARKCIDGKGGASGTMIAERIDVGIVHRGVVVDAVEQHGRLDDVVERGTFSLEQSRQIRDGLTHLRVQPIDECAVLEAQLARDIEGVARSNERCIGTDWFRHVADPSRYDAVMVGGIIIAVLLLVVVPVAIMMSGAIVAALVGDTAKKSVDGAHAGTEELTLSETNFYDGSTQT